ncbi:MAG: hypothetical protein ACJ8FY_07250 [Gemmataceae bacterium]
MRRDSDRLQAWLETEMRLSQWLFLGGLSLLLSSCSFPENPSNSKGSHSLLVGKWKRESPAATLEFTSDGKAVVILDELHQADAKTTFALGEPIKSVGTYRFVGGHTLYIELDENFRFTQRKGDWKISKLNREELILAPPSGLPLSCKRID